MIEHEVQILEQETARLNDDLREEAYNEHGGHQPITGDFTPRHQEP
jgi:hypothetical protein